MEISTGNSHVNKSQLETLAQHWMQLCLQLIAEKNKNEKQSNENKQ
jgi:hypothetical protein